MIQQLSQVAEVQNRLQNSSVAKQFNASLPVSLEVMERTHGMKYMLKVGNSALETKSLKELQVGAKYWAHMGKSSMGSIMLSNLVTQPNIMSQFLKSSLRLGREELDSLFDQKGGNPWEKMQGFFSDKLANAETRADFLFSGNLLLSLQQKVITLPFRHENDRDSLLQMRARKGINGISELEFYSIFSNLGAIRGKIVEHAEEGAYLHLATLFRSSAEFLEGELGSLRGIAKTLISVDERISPLYESSDSLLNLRG
ncbi:MAG: hypothetical protein ACTTJS_03130 [Wolinella sp.]